jgi:hypothetical protein
VLAYRVDGVSRQKLIGAKHGFGRSGCLEFIEPGLTYVRGKTTVKGGVPITINRNWLPTL